MPIPKPNKNEGQQDFMSRCISQLSKIDSDLERDQIMAICGESWREAKSAALTFLASVHSIESGDETKLATFYVMNTTRNRNGWGVSEKALEEALPTLMGKPLYLAKNYKPTDHDTDMFEAGKFIRVEKPNGYALATAEITDNKTFELLQNGIIGPISVVIGAYNATCSECNATIANKEEMMHHKCIKEGEGYELIHSFVFNRIDFVDSPAYPQAGKMGDSGRMVVSPLTLCASAYSSQSIFGRAEGSPDVKSKLPTKNKGKEMSDEEKNKLEKLEAENTDLKTVNADLKSEVDKLKKKQSELEKRLKKDADVPTTKAECEAAGGTWDAETSTCRLPNASEVAGLKRELDEIKAEKHNSMVESVAAAREAAGLEVDAEKLAALPNEVLKLLKVDADRVAAAPKPAPIRKFTAKDEDEFKAAVEKAKMNLGIKRGEVK